MLHLIRYPLESFNLYLMSKVQDVLLGVDMFIMIYRQVQVFLNRFEVIIFSKYCSILTFIIDVH